jgi:hypothetical protein
MVKQRKESLTKILVPVERENKLVTGPMRENGARKSYNFRTQGPVEHPKSR